MFDSIDSKMQILLGTVAAILVVASVAGAILAARVTSPGARATVANLNARTKSWWIMAGVFSLTLFSGPVFTTVLFGCLSFLALREFITINRTDPADHASLFWAFFIITPLHYFLIGIQWYGMVSIFIPVYAFIFLPFRRVLTGETRGFLESTAKIQWALLVCVYFVSHMPLILALPLKGYAGQNASLLFFFVLTVQLSDVLQYVWGKTCGKRPIAPAISPSKTREGTIGGIATTVLIATCLAPVTPFNWWQAGLMALLICVAGFFGGLVMSAIKRDLGTKDWGSSIGGHGGFLDRIDSLCFSAPLFYHLCGFYFGTGVNNHPPEWLMSILGK